jgi:hypothetical protein
MFSTVAGRWVPIESAAHRTSVLSGDATPDPSSTPVDERVEERKTLQNGGIFIHSWLLRPH